MTDTGQVPGEGLPENAGRVEQPGVAAPDAYTYLSDSPAEDVDLLLPGAQGAWGNEIAPPAPAPVVETVHQPGPHETDGRDSGSVDLGGVRPRPSRRPRRLRPLTVRGSGRAAPSAAPRPAAARPVREPGPLPRRPRPRRPARPPAGPADPRPRVPRRPPHARAAAPQAAPWVAQGAATPAAALADAAQAAVARVATQAVGTAVAPEGEQTPAAAHDEQVAPVTPVVPGPGAPGDAVTGGDAGGVDTGGDAGASVPDTGAGVAPDAPVVGEAGHGEVPVAEAEGAEEAQEAVVPEALPYRSSPWARSLSLRSLPLRGLPLRRRRTPGRPWACPSRSRCREP
ncbi:hypothetical protein [Streptomyces sp. MMS20-AI2-20]|uniref:hypothetical protein n=1 Tax=Streptomyces sp. MMS20-AI2-20 TaxID=2925835 RepID=UPI001F622A6B|nr:hypothetical protein [Streptomyces sp. MMS20-AI2-20]MCI4144626.1 hypothetical protein [Streptomyces sp. MMS20-AI2-20]